MPDSPGRSSMVPRRRTPAGRESPAAVPWAFADHRSRRSLTPPEPAAAAPTPTEPGSEPSPPPSEPSERPRFYQTLRERAASGAPLAPAPSGVEPPSVAAPCWQPTSTLHGMPAPTLAPPPEPARPATPPSLAGPGPAATLPRPAAAEPLGDLDAISDEGLEVTVLWAVDHDLVETLHVAHLFPPRAFVVGERQADFVAGRDTLGQDRLPLVAVDEEGVWLVVPEGAWGELLDETGAAPIESLAARGELVPSGEAPGARRLLLRPRASASVTLPGGLAYQVRRVTRPRNLAAFRRRPLDARAIVSGGASLLLNAAFVAAIVLLAAAPASRPLAPLAATRPARIVPRPPEPEEAVTRTTVRSLEGERHRGEEGRAGRPDAPETRRRLGIQGTTPRRQPARAEPQPTPPTPAPPAPVVATPTPTPPRPALPPSPIPTPPAPRVALPSWPTSTAAQSPIATGPDPRNAQGNLTGRDIGDARGAGGLGLRGTGPGGGGTGTGIGGGRVAVGQWGMDVGVSPVARDAVRRIIRSRASEIRTCYAGGSGRVTVRMVVNQSGSVQAVRVQGSAPNPRADQCAETAARRWAFPAIPNSGITVVTYPISLGAAQDA